MTQSTLAGGEALDGADIQTAWTDPSVDGPRLAFNDGQVTGITEDLNPVLPGIPGPVSADWHLTQWNPGAWFDPAAVNVAPPIVDPVLGQAAYGWQAGDSAVTVFGTPGDYTYALTDGNGNLQDLNLETGVTPPASFSFDKQVIFTAAERIAAASNFGPVDGASAANCFTVAFNRYDAANYDPRLPTISMFLQVELAVAGGSSKAYASFGTPGGNIYNVVPGSEGNQYLPGNPDGGPMHAVRIDLSSAVAQMTQWLAGADPGAGSAVLDLSKWSLTGEYIGIEASTGSSITLDVAHPMVTRDLSIAITHPASQVVSIVGGATAAMPVLVDVSDVTASASETGPLGVGATVTFNLTGSSALTQAGGTETLSLSDGGRALFSGVTDAGALTFTTTVAQGDQSADLKVVGLTLNGSTVVDRSGAVLDPATLLSAPGIDTGIVVNAVAPMIVGDTIHFNVPTDSNITITGNSFARAHLDLLGSTGAQTGAAGLNVLGQTGPHVLMLPNALGDVAISDNAGASSVIAGDGTNLSYTGDSDALIVGGAGKDIVVAGNGSDTIALGSGANQIFLGSGNSVVYSEGTDLVQAGSGHDTVSVGGRSATINGGYGSSTLLVDDSAGAGTVINASTGATVQGSSSSVTTINAYGDTTVHGGAGGTRYNEENGTLKFVGVGGSVTIAGSQAAGNDTLYGASGANIILTSQAHDNVFVANDPRYCDGGNVTLDGGLASGGNQFWAGSGNASLIGGTGGDTMVGGAGSVTMVGGIGSAANAFDLFEDGSGPATKMTIKDFGANADNTITLFGFGQDAAAASLQAATEAGGATTLHLVNGATIILDGVTVGQLTTRNVFSTGTT